MDFTTTALLSKIKLWAAIPTGQPAFSDASLLSLLTDELLMNITPWMMGFREEFFVTYSESAITDGGSYNIPMRAVGSVLREVKRISGTDICNVRRIEIEELDHASDFCFYIQGSKIYLRNSTSFTNDTLRLYYHRMPNTLVAESACAKVASVAGNVVTCVSVPTAFGTSLSVDVIGGEPPFESRGDDLSVAVSGTDITFSTLPTVIQEGDWICAAQTSPVAQVPWEVTAMLCQAVVVRVNEILDDQGGLQKAVDKYKQMESRMENTLAPRVIGEGRAIVMYDEFL